MFDITLPLETRVKQLSMEDGLMSDVIGLFRQTIPELATNLVEKIKSISDSDEDKEISAIVAKATKLNKALQDGKVSFIIFEKTLVSVPEGFKGKLVKYAELLSRHDAVIATTLLADISAFRKTLLVALSGKHLEAPISNNDTRFVRGLIEKREELQEAIASFFVDDGRSKQRLGDVIDRFADLKVLSDAMLAHRKVGNRTKAVKKAASDITELLDSAINRANDEGAGNINPDVAKYISETTYEIAKQIEMYAVFQFRYDQFEAAVDSIIDQLNELFK